MYISDVNSNKSLPLYCCVFTVYIITFYEHTYPGPRAWPAREYRIPNNFQIMFTIVRACQYLLAEELLEHLADKLQVESQVLWGNPHSVRNLVWKKYRVVLIQVTDSTLMLSLQGAIVSDGPCRVEVKQLLKQLPCCMRDVHHECFAKACQQYYFNCPHCSCSLNGHIYK